MASVGQTLVDERRRQGKSLSDVEAATHVRGRLLEALENGEWEQLPSPAYVKGYIQSYASFLGIPADPLLEAYRAEIRLAEPPTQTRLLEPVLPTREQSHALPMRTGVTIVAVIAVAALLVWGVSAALRGPEEPPPVPVVPTEDATGTPGAGSAEGAAPLGGAPGVGTATPAPDTVVPTPKAGKPFELSLRVAADQASWVRVMVDGLKAYEGTLAGGQSKTWTVSRKATLTIGRPSAVTVLRDGEKVAVPSDQDVPTFTLTVAD